MSTASANITLVAPGPREVVDEKRARDIISHWKKELTSKKAELNDGTFVSCDRLVLSNKSYTAVAANLIARFLTAKEDHSEDNDAGAAVARPPLAATIRVADLSDVIASRMEDEGLQVLRTLCDALKYSSLEEVDLSDNAMGSKGVAVCASVLSGQRSSLRRLSLCNNGLDERAMHEVADILCGGREDGVSEGLDVGASTICERLTKIHFFNNMSGDGGCRAFARILSRCSADLEDVRFSGTRAGREGSLIVSSALENLGQNIINLRRLDLADNSFGSDGGSTLAKALRRCVSLTRLNLRDCVLEDDAAGEVCRAVWTADAPLEMLDLSGNEITGKGAKSIAELIEENGSTLCVLHCEENEMTSKGVSYVAGAIGVAIEEIRLGSNECGSVAAAALMTAYGDDGTGMPALKAIHLDNNMFPEDTVKELEACFGDKLVEMEDNIDDEDVDDNLSEDEEEEDDDEDEEDDEEQEIVNKRQSIDDLAKALEGTNIHDLV